MQLQSVDAELSRLAAQAQDSPASSPQRLTPSQLAVLATGLGRKHGVKVVFGDSRTAQTDGETVVMPLTSKENSWIVRGYLDHEVGHVRLTNLNIIPQESPLHRSLWNVLEDVRIERTMASLYPGMATNLRVLISQLRKTKAGVFELAPDSPPEAVITAYVSLMLRSLHLGQPEVADLAQKTREQFLKTFGPQIERDLFALISDIETAGSSEDVVSIVGRIIDLLKQRAREKPPKPEPKQQENQPQEHPQEEPQEAFQDGPEAPQSEPQPDMPDEDNEGENGDTGQPESPDEDVGKQHGNGDGQTAQQGESGQNEEPDRDQPAHPDSRDGGQQESDSPGDSDEQQADGSESSSSGKTGEDANSQAAEEPGNADCEAENDTDDEADGDGDTTDRQNNTIIESGSTGVGDSGAAPPLDTSRVDPVREAVIQALQSQEEQADLGEQLKALVRQREADLGLDAFSIRIATPTRQSTLADFGYRKHLIRSSTSVVAKLSGKLRGLLQAQALNHAKPSAAGSRIARSRLHRIRTGESKLFLRNDQVRQVNTAIHLLIDNSGSMRLGQRFPITRDVCMALVKALSPIRGVNLGLTIFPAHGRSTTCDPHTGVPTTSVDTLMIHGQKPGTMIYWPPNANGGTPLAESLRYVLSAMYSLTEPRKIVVILTDGDPNDRRDTEMAFKEAADLKIELVTLGIEDVRHPDIFPAFEIVANVRDLPEKAFRLLEKLLIK